MPFTLKFAYSKELKDHGYCFMVFNTCFAGSDVTLADVMAHKYNMAEGGNVNPRMDPHGELVNQNVLTQIPKQVGIRISLLCNVPKYLQFYFRILSGSKVTSKSRLP